MNVPWPTAAELAALGLVDWPSSEFRSRARLVKLAVPSRLREGQRGGGGREYDPAGLPLSVRRALLEQHLLRQSGQVQLVPLAQPAPPSAQQASAASAAPPAQASQPPAGRSLVAAKLLPAVPAAPRTASREETACADARAVLVQRLRELGQVGGMTRAAEMLSQQLASGAAGPELLRQATAANRRPREADGPGVRISARTLFRWLTQWRSGGWWALVPAPTEATPLAAVADDVALALNRYASTSGAARNLTHVCQDVTDELGRPFDEWRLLYDRTRRALPKANQVALIKSRHTGAERAAKLPFKRRNTATLLPNDVWLIDGHTFKAKVRHPDHGQPFAPEVTVAKDAATRRIVGWSVSLSENTIAVGDCLRHAVGQHGVPAIVYSDNGAGERAKVFDCPLVGLFARLGTEHRTGIAGHPQGHGLIERSWQTHMIRCARQFGSYQGADVDERTLRNVTLELQREQRALRRAEAGGDVVRLSPKVPSWAQFIDAVAHSVQTYNARHRHRALPKHASGEAAGRHMTPDEAWAAMLVPEQQVMLDALALRHLFMPSVLRTPANGEVRFLNQHYFAAELMQVDGQQVRVDYDIHDGGRVWVWTIDGRFICEAVYAAAGKGGNNMPYFPVSAVEAARERRVRGIVRRREAQIDTALRELVPTLPSATAAAGGMVSDSGLPLLERVDTGPATASAPVPTRSPASDARPLFDCTSDRYEWLMQHRQAWQADDAAWLSAYVTGAEYADLRDYFTSRGLAWPDDAAAFNSAG